MPMKGAGLDPSQHASAGTIENGDYLIVDVKAAKNYYNGQVPEGSPAILVTYKSVTDGMVALQFYKVGDNDHLIPSDDGKRFVHPRGEAASILKGGAGSMWLGSLVKQGWTFDGDDVSQVAGLTVTLENFPGPKGK